MVLGKYCDFSHVIFPHARVLDYAQVHVYLRNGRTDLQEGTTISTKNEDNMLR